MSRVGQKLKQNGAISMRAWLAQRSSSTYEQLAAELGPEVMPIEVADEQLREALRIGADAYREAARDVLRRYMISILTRGWNRTEGTNGVESTNTIPFALWAAALSGVKAQPDGASLTMGAALERTAASGWIPKSADDSTLLRAFEQAWPSD